MDPRKKDLDELLSELDLLEEAPTPLTPEAPAGPEAQDPKGFLEAFLQGLLLRLDPAYTFEIRAQGSSFLVEVRGGDLGRLIGKEGRTLKALEYLIGLVLARRFPEHRVVLDAAGYRKRQEERIKRLAEEAALTVALTGEPLHLPPMRASERRIVHMLLKDHPRVTTESQGEGEERHVVVYPRAEALPGAQGEA